MGWRFIGDFAVLRKEGWKKQLSTRDWWYGFMYVDSKTRELVRMPKCCSVLDDGDEVDVALSLLSRGLLKEIRSGAEEE